MRGSFAKALFAVAVLANLLLGLPMQAAASMPASAHDEGRSHAVSDHGGAHGHHAAVNQHQHEVAAPDCGSQQQLPSADGAGDCHCQAGLCSPTLAGQGAGLWLTWKPRPDHGLPLSDQIALSATVLPPLRPPRA